MRGFEENHHKAADSSPSVCYKIRGKEEKKKICISQNSQVSECEGRISCEPGLLLKDSSAPPQGSFNISDRRGGGWKELGSIQEGVFIPSPACPR